MGGVCRNNLTDKNTDFFHFNFFTNYTLICVFNTSPKGICSRATFKMFNFLISRFSKGIKVPIWHALGCKGTERCGYDGVETERCCKVRLWIWKLPLVKLHIWEVAT